MPKEEVEGVVIIFAGISKVKHWVNKEGGGPFAQRYAKLYPALALANPRWTRRKTNTDKAHL